MTLVGHDWGAAQAWMFAIRRVRPLQRLVIMNVPHPACMHRELRTFRQLLKSWYIFFFQIPWLPEKLLCARTGEGGRRLVREDGRRHVTVSRRGDRRVPGGGTPTRSDALDDQLLPGRVPRGPADGRRGAPRDRDADADGVGSRGHRPRRRRPPTAPTTTSPT